MLRTIPVLIALLLCAATVDAEDDPRVAWLADHAVPLRSIDPADDDFADLAPLAGLLDGVRVVQLGEPTHGDGACFLAKTRLIRYLHEKLGFDVLVFESGLYDCRKAWEAYRAGEVEPLTAAQKGIFPIWTRSAQVRPLIDYLAKRARSDRPLELAGFDCQLTGTASRDMGADLEETLRRVDPTLPTNRVWKTVRMTLDLLADGGRKLRSGERDVGVEALGKLRENLMGRAEPVDPFLLQLLFSLAEQVEVRYAEGAKDHSRAARNRRDIQMGKNMVWLAKEAYPDRKIIVWAATYHLMRNAPTLRRTRAGESYEGTVTMGDLVAKALGKEHYTLGVTAAEGAVGRPWAAAYPVTTPPAGSLEDLCVKAGLENAWIDLRKPARGGEWLGEPLVARPLGLSPMKGDWSDVVDGMLFLKRMTPSTDAARPPVERMAAGASLLEAVKAGWGRIERGLRTNQYWVDTWSFDPDYETWTGGRPTDADAVAAEQKKILEWFEARRSAEGLAWRVHLLLARMDADQGEAKTAIEHLDSAIAAYPDRAYEDPTRQSTLQHLVNRRAMLVWDESGFRKALAGAVGAMEKDERHRFLYVVPWTRRLAEEGKEKAIPEFLVRVRKAYEARAKRFPDRAEEARRFAAGL